MNARWAHAVAAALLECVCCKPQVGAQEGPATLSLVLQVGRTLRVRLDQRVRVRGVGQPVSGTLAEAIYVSDRLVLAAGDRVEGHISARCSLEPALGVAAMIAGDSSSHATVQVMFDTVTSDDGRRLTIATLPTSGAPRALAAAPTPPSSGVKGRITGRVHQKVEQTPAAVAGTAKLGRLWDLALGQLPYHPQPLPNGTTYSATLTASVELGVVTPLEYGPAASPLPPSTVLHVRLLTPRNSSVDSRGAVLDAVLSRPVLSQNQRLMVPEGALLDGHVTFVRPARRFRRNRQLRFLVESLQARSGRVPFQASLHAADMPSGGRLSIDDEGGAAINSPKSRFIAPVLAVLTLVPADVGRADVDGRRVGSPDQEPVHLRLRTVEPGTQWSISSDPGDGPWS